MSKLRRYELNEQDNLCRAEDDYVVMNYKNKDITARMIMDKFINIAYILRTDIDVKTKKSEDGKIYKVTNKYGTEIMKKTISHKSNGGNSRVLQYRDMTFKLKRRKPVFAVSALIYDHDPGNDGLLFQDPLFIPRQKISNEDKYEMIRRLIPSLKNYPNTADNSLSLTMLRDLLRIRKDLDDKYMITKDSSAYSEVKGSTQLIQDTFNINNRKDITDVCTILWLTSHGKEFLYTENAMNQGIIKIPDELIFLFKEHLGG